MTPLRRFAVRGPPKTRAIHPHPLVVLSLRRPLQRPRASPWLLGQKDSCIQDRPLVTLPSPDAVLYPSKVYFSVVMNRRHFPYDSFATTSDRSTLVDQPTIMLRNVSQPSAKTRNTCGTTKKM